MDEQLKTTLEGLIRAAYDASADIGHEVERILKEGWESPLNEAEVIRLLTMTIEHLKKSPALSGDASVQQSMGKDISKLVSRVIETRERIAHVLPRQTSGPSRPDSMEIYPRPCFHGVYVPMLNKEVSVRDIDLWNDNHRLETHISQFEDRNGRKPSSDELLSIMLSHMDLPGIPDQSRDDQFEIVKLAQSIAENGVRRPPILDNDMTLLDGNRRVAACLHILNSPKFSPEQKRRVEKIPCWQLTPYATDKDREAIIISLNFEDDCKEPWPEYVKARIVYDHWQAMLAMESEQSLTPEREKALRKSLAERFAIEHRKAERYLAMVGLAQEFEDYHVNENGKDVYEAKHHADRYFQYFDELTRGRSPGGVFHTLNQDETLKRTVFDLLFDGKLRNWRIVRWLRFTNEETMAALVRAKGEEKEIAQDTVEDALATAFHRSRESRDVSAAAANSRIKNFAEWLEGLPPSAFRDSVRTDNLQALLKALQLVAPIVRDQLRIS